MLTNKLTTLKAIEDKILLHGRCLFDKDALYMSWSASGFSMRFVGTAISFSFLPYPSDAESTSNDERAVAVKLEVDGTPTKASISGAHSVVFADGLSDGEHTLRLLKISESDHPIGIGEVQIVGECPEVLDLKKDYSFKLEVIGDSITCGYGAFGSRNTFYFFEEDATAAYAFMVGEHFGADTRLISWSGRGISKAWNGDCDNRFIDFYKRNMRMESYGAHDFDSWKADVVVINAGTNDEGRAKVPPEEFEEKLTEFYNFVRSVYPHAKIVFFYGAMRVGFIPTYEALIPKLRENDKQVYFYKTAPIDATKNEVGANGHPSYIGQKRLADELISALNEII